MSRTTNLPEASWIGASHQKIKLPKQDSNLQWLASLFDIINPYLHYVSLNLIVL
jgi:hypothetical protein